MQEGKCLIVALLDTTIDLRREEEREGEREGGGGREGEGGREGGREMCVVCVHASHTIFRRCLESFTGS